MCIYIYTYACTYIYIYIHTHYTHITYYLWRGRKHPAIYKGTIQHTKNFPNTQNHEYNLYDHQLTNYLIKRNLDANMVLTTIV